MKKKIVILGSTGSIGKSSINIIKQYRSKLKIITLSTHKNINLIIKQSREFNVYNLIISDPASYKKISKMKLNSKIKLYKNVSDFLKINKEHFDITIIGISGFDGLEPTLQIIERTKILSSANKESIICGWKFIKQRLNKFKTKFIPLDSEHFSIWSLIKNSNIKMISDIYLTASGGPFFNQPIKKIKKANISDVIKHPSWIMGKKISVDSATMMNKIFELIEASKIFNLNINKFKFIIHPSSYIHAIVNFKYGLTKFLLHETTMEIPIFNSIFNEYKKPDYYKIKKINFERLNGINFFNPKLKYFPYLNILKKINKNDTYFEIILVTLNDELVKLFLKKKISFYKMQQVLIKLLKRKKLSKYYNKTPNNINDINCMVEITRNYLKKIINEKYQNLHIN